MSGLLRTLNTARVALGANQVALQTTGNNIANVNTEGYSRQRVIFQNAKPAHEGFGFVGVGVEVATVERIISQSLISRLRSSGSDAGKFDSMSTNLRRLEATFNEFSDTDISSAFDRFFAALDDVANDPTSSATRRTAIEAGQFLSESFVFVADSVNLQRKQMSDEIRVQVQKANEYITEIAGLNEDIQRMEGGGALKGEANDMRDRRELAIQKLSEIVNVHAVETPTGVINVLVGNEYVVLDDDVALLDVELSADGDVPITTPVFQGDREPLAVTSGRLAGLIQARDVEIKNVMGELDNLAKNFIAQMNQLQATGRGLNGLTSIESRLSITNTAAPIDQSELKQSFKSGNLVISVTDETTGQTRNYNIAIQADGTATDTSLEGLVESINSTVGAEFSDFQASITADNKLKIETGNDNHSFYFNDDSSGVLVALGINEFFSGSRAIDIVVASNLRSNPDTLAAAKSTNPGDNTNAVSMARLRYDLVMSNDTATFEDYYNNVVGDLGAVTSQYNTRATNQKYLHDQLLNERNEISGVSLDEEASNLILYQRAFQANARMIGVVDNLLDILMNSF